ncbi:hypothetical protein E2C01_086711 [Portunus trituberculatus]|uniref:Uncharacterized protein n=1 Tax=Portunus trituberculatus TaxID=210409 RepID=A0A5B7JA20_PORTR|nr:hypothetical protein [Portunus trituberculatus]
MIGTVNAPLKTPITPHQSVFEVEIRRRDLWECQCRLSNVYTRRTATLTHRHLPPDASTHRHTTPGRPGWLAWV